jgi:hypothetical protein
MVSKSVSCGIQPRLWVSILQESDSKQGIFHLLLESSKNLPEKIYLAALIYDIHKEKRLSNKELSKILGHDLARTVLALWKEQPIISLKSSLYSLFTLAKLIVEIRNSEVLDESYIKKIDEIYLPALEAHLWEMLEELCDCYKNLLLMLQQELSLYAELGGFI